MKRLALLIIYGAFGTFGLAQETVLQESEKSLEQFVGEVVYIRGQALLTRDGENFKIQKQNAVRRNDKIKTGPNSIVIIGMGPELSSKMKIDQDSEVIVDFKSPNSKRDAPKNEFDSTVDVVRGSINVIFNKNRAKDNNLNIKTKYTTFGIRGTEFFVHAGINDTAFLAVKEGTVTSLQYNRKEKKTVESQTGKDWTLILSRKLERFAEEKPDWFTQINWGMEDKKYHFHKPSLLPSMYSSYDKNIKDKGRPEKVEGMDTLMNELDGGGSSR